MQVESSDSDIFMKLSHLKEVLGAITDMMPDRHFIVNETGNILCRFGNTESEQFYEVNNYNPTTVAEFTSAENTKNILATIEKSLQTQSMIVLETSSKIEDVNKLMPNISGPIAEQWFELRIRPLHFKSNDKSLVIISTRNITERKLKEIRLQTLSLTDPLTQLYNRRYATDELTRNWQRFVRYQKDITVLMLDIDFFKKINDTYGHDAGDQVLVTLSHFLKANIRNIDTIARLGGEEFLIIMPDVAVNNVQAACERLIFNISQLKIPLEDKQLNITVSGGLGQFSQRDKNMDTLLKRVDRALYQAKEQGRNRINIA
ncbi:hypothetical protein CW745_15520 [Psychromonas sp. psych-6C06]|uniref:GGDEF domain-containing protein n=1 Tax=Psychromonas sp. psych-6C06 TaxID=2058089 RepID=UPI000C333112|nr:GGDEF domain-containing protein [Psychromonas sp. psych-6C06]PKF60351.1 hypothetical protein CW745_15520 [Psychromonas sp. psych-6C06]